MSRFHWGWRISLVYTAFALSTLGFVAFAMTQRVDLVRDDYYQESLRTMASQQELQRGRSAGLRVAFDGAMMRIGIDSLAALPGVLTVHLYRPDNPALDRTSDITPTSTGEYQYPIPGIQSGKWHVIVRWNSDGVYYAYDQSVMIP